MDSPDPTEADAGAQKWQLRLYVADGSPKCVTAFENLQRTCEKFLADRYQIEVVDLLENPRRAADDQILAVPTLGRRRPEPVRRIIGDLSDSQRLLAGLQISARTDEQT